MFIYLISTIIIILFFFGSLHLLGKFIPVLWVSNSILVFSVIVKYLHTCNLLLCSEINKVK